MKLPFVIDRDANMSLREQMVQGLKKSIVKGVFKPGELLPGIDELAKATGVSEKISRQALAHLAEIGWCVSRRGSKSVVADRGKERLGRVLFFNSETGFGFHSSWLVDALRSRLLKADYRLTAISAYDLRADGSSRLLSESLKEHWDLVIEFGMRPGARKAIEESGWPFLVLGDGGRAVPSTAANCVGQVELLNGLAVPDFVRACARKGIRSVVQFLYDEGGFDVEASMDEMKISCQTVRIPRYRRPIGMYEGAYAAVSSLLQQPDRILPDVFLFTDDHLAQSGLLALLKHGVRIPEDVRVVTHANRGLGPFWTTPLTRLEMDPVAQGAALAKAVIEFFKKHRFPQDVVLGSVWKPGKTF